MSAKVILYWELRRLFFFDMTVVKLGEGGAGGGIEIDVSSE